MLPVSQQVLVLLLCALVCPSVLLLGAHPSSSATRSAGVEAVAELNRLFNRPRSFGVSRSTLFDETDAA